MDIEKLLHPDVDVTLLTLKELEFCSTIADSYIILSKKTLEKRPYGWSLSSLKIFKSSVESEIIQRLKEDE